MRGEAKVTPGESECEYGRGTLPEPAPSTQMANVAKKAIIAAAIPPSIDSRPTSRRSGQRSPRTPNPVTAALLSRGSGPAGIPGG